MAAGDEGYRLEGCLAVIAAALRSWWPEVRGEELRVITLKGVMSALGMEWDRRQDALLDTERSVIFEQAWRCPTTDGLHTEGGLRVKPCTQGIKVSCQVCQRSVTMADFALQEGVALPLERIGLHCARNGIG